MANNKDLQSKYEEMHKQGVSAWFSDGREERETILKMGEPWKELRVLEVGCGEGDLAYRMNRAGATVVGVDYSIEAITKALVKYTETERLQFFVGTYKSYGIVMDRIVMQGVLEHLDDPFTELKWMMDNLLGEHGDVITSSPCFLNPRGIVWMTLDMLGAVMSKTDLHYLHPQDFGAFCDKYNYNISGESCDYSWAGGPDMVKDLMQRIPLALKDGNLPEARNLEEFLTWTQTIYFNFHGSSPFTGATMVYRITK